MESVGIDVLIMDLSILLVLARIFFWQLIDPHKCVILFQMRMVYANEFNQNNYPKST